MVELRLESLYFLEVIDEGGLGNIPLEIHHGGRLAFEPLRFHEAAEFLDGGFQLLDDHRGLLDQPDFPRLISSFFPGKKGDGRVHGLLLLAEVENVAVRLGAVKHAIRAGKCLNQAVVLEGLVHIERVQVFGIEPGQQHIDDDCDVDLVIGNFRVGFTQIGVRPLLVLDPLLHILIVKIELAQAVIRPVANIEFGEDRLKGFLFLFWFDLIVFLFLRQILGKLFNILFGCCILGELRGG